MLMHCEINPTCPTCQGRGWTGPPGFIESDDCADCIAWCAEEAREARKRMATEAAARGAALTARLAAERERNATEQRALTTARMFARAAMSGNVELMRRACDAEDANGDFRDATEIELAEVLYRWALEAVEQ